MDENQKDESVQKEENTQNNGSENPIQSNKNIILQEPQEQKEQENKNENSYLKQNKDDELSILKDVDLIQEKKSNNYENLIKKLNYVDFRTRDEKPWQIGLVLEIYDDIYIVEDSKEKKKYQIKKDDFSKVSYFRKNSIPDNEENFYLKRENKETLQKKLNVLEKLTKDEKDNIFNQDIWDTYYVLHSKFYLGLDSAMKVNINKYSYNYLYGNEEEENEGVEESFKIILCILTFLSMYYKYIGENFEEFIYYKNKIMNTELEDLKIVNKKCAFFSFFDESCDLLNKIFANVKHCLYWYTTFESELRKIIPSPPSEENEEEENDIENESEYPQYEVENEKEKNEAKNNRIKLKKICLNNAYRPVTTFTTENVKVRAIFVAYFIDYFNAINGFSNLAKLIYSMKSFDLTFLSDILQKFMCAKVLTNSYSKTLVDERKKIYEYLDNVIENLDDKTISENKIEEIMSLIKYASNLFFKDNPKITEKFKFHLISKNLISSKKLEQKINSLTLLNDILKKIKSDSTEKKSKKSNISLEEFCEYCRNYKILHILYDKNIHEEITKRIPDIIYVMYKNNFGYEKNEENMEKINSDKKLIFDVLFDKLLESEQNNEKLVINLQNIICDFCEILNDEDKIIVYKRIINYIEKSIEKKGIPMKEHFNFIIDYSIKAIEEEDDDEENDNKEEINKTEKIKNGGDNKTIYDEKKINEQIENNEYYGLNFLIKYLSEENFNKYSMTNEQKIELINLSITGIIKIIILFDIPYQNLVLKYICSKISFSIKNTKDILQYLILLDRLKSSEKLGKQFYKIFEEFILKEDFISLLMNDMDRYLLLITKNSEEIKEKDSSKVYEGLFNNELNIKLRLDLIFFLLQKQKISTENLEDFNNKIIISCEKNILASDLLNKLLYSNINNFSHDVINFFYNKVLNSDIKEEKLNDYQYYIFCTAIIKEINKIENHFYFMNNKDLAVMNCEFASNIKGIELFIFWD